MLKRIQSFHANDEKNPCAACPTPGCCCYFGTIVAGMHVASDIACEHLDTETGKCRVYDKRHEVSQCLSIEVMIELGFVPPWCRHLSSEQYKSYWERTDRRRYAFDILEFDSGSRRQAIKPSWEPCLASKRAQAAQKELEREENLKACGEEETRG